MLTHDEKIEIKNKYCSLRKKLGKRNWDIYIVAPSNVQAATRIKIRLGIPYKDTLKNKNGWKIKKGKGG